MNDNLFVSLRDGFPAALDATALEIADGNAPSRTWRDIDRASARIANLLDALKLPAGSRVALQADKSVDALMTYLATLRAGFVFLPLNTAYRPAEMEYFIVNAEPAVIVCAGANFGSISAIAFRVGIQHVFSLNDDGSGSLLDCAGLCSDQHTPAQRSLDDVAAILYTSGTTGRSKGAMLSHGNLLSNAATLKVCWGWQPGDVLIHALPIFHTHGLFVAAHGALLNGSKMLWFNRFDPAAVVARLPEATVFMGVPTLYVRMLQEPALTVETCRHMRLFLAGSAPLLPETFDQWRELTGHTILERYGMSETVMLTSNPYYPTDGARRAGTVGYPLPGVGLRVMSDQGAACAIGEIGGIEVKGPNVFRGYWRAPALTEAEFSADGWFRTGDLGKIDESGYVVIVGRSKDLIITGGYNVYPAEVEGYLNDMPGVAESAVIGVPHPDFGEAVVAVVSPKPGITPDVSALIAELKAAIANFKVPKHLFVVDALPRNAMGKVQKNLLREQHKGVFFAGRRT
jgi:malonyl-CoA/methylmalonyl-CoA synthetase